MADTRPHRRMVAMDVLETSGVDHPAHGYEGWLVKKAASPTQAADLMALLKKEGSPVTDTIASLKEEVAKSAASPEAKTALTKAIDLAPDVETAAQLWRSLRDKAEAGDPETPSGQEPTAPAAAPVSADAAGADLFKSVTDPAIRTLLEKQASDNASLRIVADKALAKAASEEAVRLDSEATTMAKAAYADLAIDHGDVAPALRKLAISDPASAAIFKKALDSAQGQLEAANAFGEIGTRQVAPTSGAFEKATTLAKGYVAAGVSDNMTAAMAKAWSDNPALYTEYEKETR